MTEPAAESDQLAPVVYRPRQIRVVAWIAAIVVVVAAIALSAALAGPINESGPATFTLVDRLGLLGLGLIGAAMLLTLTRPLVAADEAGIRVRNVLGDRRLSWGVVRAVRYERGASWAVLELADDDVLGVLAVQAVDKERAVAAARALRARHAAYHRRASSSSQ
ncbi:PH domain-containing protein [Natronosporangium hydrolyticum]|uniref:PH domain-containing protein n=1 Tax=Natronosporangium hydrolyticum TaxID=2811111 RepID=A0A895YHH3_9ACTN|nr:PH domain-containing protein [Natronosporangium hydrolyticum]QSB16991.1 PH domain-containing protein [Natronosporangium hydrolyticum]